MDQNLKIENTASLSSDLLGKYFTFYTDNQIYGLPIANVIQIVGMQDITIVPEFPHYAKGIINLRGSIIPVIDIRLRFSKPESEYNDRTCIIITNIRNLSIGLIVDFVDEVADIASQNISKMPRMSTDLGEDYVSGIARHQDKIIMLLNIEKIISENAGYSLSNY